MPTGLIPQFISHVQFVHCLLSQENSKHAPDNFDLFFIFLCHMTTKLASALAAILLGILSASNIMATEEPKFRLIEKSGDFEPRLYDPMIFAETRVQGSLDEASNAGFRLIAGYIFGGNKAAPGRPRKRSR